MSLKVYNFNDFTGATHKELGVEELVDDAEASDLEGIVIISSGNFSFAIGEELRRRKSPLKLVNLVGGRPKKGEVQIPNGKILRTNDERVELVRSSGLDLRMKDYTDFIPTAYHAHAVQILAGNPDYVICPIGSGKLWFSIVQAVKSQDLDTRVIGVTPKGKNAFFPETQKGSFDSIADKLTAPYTHLHAQVLEEAPLHIVGEVSERQLKLAYRKAKQDSVECEESGAAGFVVYDREFSGRYGINHSNHNIVVVSTGKGMGAMELDLKRAERKRQVGTVGTSLATLAFLFGIGVQFNQNYQAEQERQYFLDVADNTPSDKLALSYIAGRDGINVSQLSVDQISDAMTLSSMDSTGMDYIIHSKNPRKAKMYQDYSMRCKLHHGCEFGQEWKRRLRHLGPLNYKTG